VLVFRMRDEGVAKIERVKDKTVQEIADEALRRR
jgi:hypothetical protein